MDLTTFESRKTECGKITQSLRSLSFAIDRSGLEQCQERITEIRTRFRNLMDSVKTYAPKGEPASVETDAYSLHVARTLADYPGLSKMIWGQ